ncbi:hypothetical protein EV178_000212 [Coemansia sp. RSA 1646]|nr:hypothetical protein EV178_000212 [Coemansia sp. RSA 1646]KAJ2090479.1 hypothetical protein IW138_002691 [Coemansia sp. RSA 986]
MPSPPRSSLSHRRERSRESLVLQEPPPEYSLLPRDDETYIDAGAGTPIVRAQPSHIVVNPSDPRSQYSQRYYNNRGAPPVPPRRTETSSGPIPVNPRLPPRLNVGYERIETAPHLTPRTFNSLPHIRDDRAHASSAGDSLYPNFRRGGRSQAERTHLLASTPAVESGPSPNRNRSYSSGRSRHPPPRNMTNGNYPGLIAHRYPPHHPQNTGYQHPVTYTVVCPNCRNTGWVGSRTPCSCPVGTVASNSGTRPYGSSFLFGLLDDILDPNSRLYPPHSHPGHRGYR